VITAKHRGGGNKRLYRIIDFSANRRTASPPPSTAIEYDPNRSCFIALIRYEDGDKAYILAPNGLKVGTVIHSGPTPTPTSGNCLRWRTSPVGLEVHNIEMNPGQGGKLVRSAGRASPASVPKRGTGPSSSCRRRDAAVRSACRATIGQLSNLDLINVSIGKAGRSRHMGIPPAHPCEGDEPDRPPAGRRRGPQQRWPPPGQQDGVPSKGGITRSQKSTARTDPPPPQVRQAPGAAADGGALKKLLVVSCWLLVKETSRQPALTSN
jgi:large subunit ribosomal protein L2